MKKALATIIMVLTVLPQLLFAVTTTNLGSYWKMDEASGTRADSHGANTLADGNTVAAGTGILNNGADFESGNSEYLEDTTPSGLRCKDDFTVSMWLKFESTGLMWLIDKKSEVNQDFSVYAIYLNSTTINLRTTNGSAASNQDDGVSWTPSTATWYHLAVTRAATSGNVKFYVNGSQQGTTQSGYVGTLHDDADRTIRIGRYKLEVGENSRPYDGVMDEVGVWCRELSSADVTDLYNSGAAVAYPFSVAAAPDVGTFYWGDS